MVASPDGGGYTVATADGVVLALGDAQAYGGLTLNPDATPVSAIIGNGAGTGYWLLDPEAWTYSLHQRHAGSRRFPGSSAIVAAVASQIEPDPDTGYFCNPYGPVRGVVRPLRHLGLAAGRDTHPLRTPSSGDIYYWAAAHGALLPPTATPAPGDAVLYGTGPQNVYTSVHVAIVTQVWPDGAIDTVDGDSGPGRDRLALGDHQRPVSPRGLASYNGVGIYAFAQP